MILAANLINKQEIDTNQQEEGVEEIIL
jgi:hypothetical protein